MLLVPHPSKQPAYAYIYIYTYIYEARELLLVPLVRGLES